MTRFRLYSALILTLVQMACLELSASAAIVYTEGFGTQHGFGWPDRGVYVQDIDLDGDGAYDYYFRGGEIGFRLVPMRENGILCVKAVPPDLGSFAVGFEAGAMIGSLPEFGLWIGNDEIAVFEYGPIVIGMLNGAVLYSAVVENEVGYLALEFHREDGVHYGWLAIRSQLIHNNWVDVMGWAWETDPGKPILAGAIPEPSAGLFGTLAAGVWLLRRKRRADDCLSH